ncbi:hypothetical protein ACFVP8_07780 [Viridibacillus arvi]|uniref:hypothetical protein n=1 Tax=Viridibacillus arvi TaxID=263475 RepID=UPI0036B3244B
MKREEVLEVIVEGCFSYRLWGAVVKFLIHEITKQSLRKQINQNSYSIMSKSF